jgi:hypothetical protein
MQISNPTAGRPSFALHDEGGRGASPWRIVTGADEYPLTDIRQFDILPDNSCLGSGLNPLGRKLGRARAID